MRIPKKTIDFKWLIGLLLSFCCCAFYAALVSFKTMPITEGWYTEYAWQINHGNLPYRDFEFLFFPLYAYLIAGFTSVFGYSIIALRILGVLLFGSMGAMLYILFSKLFNKLAAFVTAVVTLLFLQSENAQVFYDYIRFHDFFTIVTTYFLVCCTQNSFSEESPKQNKHEWVVCVFIPVLLFVSSVCALLSTKFVLHRIRFVFWLLVCLFAVVAFFVLRLYGKKAYKKYANSWAPILCGIAVAIESMIKQSNGILMIVMIICYFIFCGIVLNNKKFFHCLLEFLSGLIAVFSVLVLYLVATGSLNIFIDSCFKTALSVKGGAGTALFRCVVPIIQSVWLYREQAIIVLLLLLFGIYHFYKMPRESKIGSRAESITLVLMFLGAVVAIFAFVESHLLADKISPHYSGPVIAVVVFGICTILFALWAIHLIVCRIRKHSIGIVLENHFMIFPVLGVAFAQGYGSAMSGGVATSQVAIGFGLLLAMMLFFLFTRETKVLYSIVMVASVFLTATFVSIKTVQTYAWWGFDQGPRYMHTEEVDIPLLQGIKVREKDKICYETIYRDILDNTKDGDSIYVFPNCPIFYTMTDRHSVTYSKVQWFDVSSMGAITEDIERLRQNKPCVIVMCNLPETAYAGHESLFSTYQTRTMRDFLLGELIGQGEYELLHTVELENGISISTYDRCE